MRYEVTQEDKGTSGFAGGVPLLLLTGGRHEKKRNKSILRREHNIEVEGCPSGGGVVEDLGGGFLRGVEEGVGGDRMGIERRKKI